jgi:hypothetical protein
MARKVRSRYPVSNCISLEYKLTGTYYSEMISRLFRNHYHLLNAARPRHPEANVNVIAEDISFIPRPVIMLSLLQHQRMDVIRKREDDPFLRECATLLKHHR